MCSETALLFSLVITVLTWIFLGVVRKLDFNKLDQKYSNFINIYYIDIVRITKNNFSNYLIFIKLEYFKTV